MSYSSWAHLHRGRVESSRVGKHGKDRHALAELGAFLDRDEMSCNKSVSQGVVLLTEHTHTHKRVQKSSTNKTNI